MTIESQRYIYKGLGNGLIIPVLDLKPDQRGVIQRVNLYTRGTLAGQALPADLFRYKELGANPLRDQFLHEFEVLQVLDEKGRSAWTYALEKLTDVELEKIARTSQGVYLPIDELKELKALEVRLSQELPDYRDSKIPAAVTQELINLCTKPLRQ